MLRGPTTAASVGAAYACGKAPPSYVWTAADYAALRAAAKTLNCVDEDLLLVLYRESLLNPKVAHCIGGSPSAIGLNQITWSPAAQGMGMTKFEWLSMLDMTAAEQMPYVVRYFQHANKNKPFSKAPDAVTLYQWNIAPGTVPNEVIFTSTVFPCPADSSLWAATDYYCHNKGLDKNNDGVITRTDIADVLAATRKSAGYQKALSELRGTSPVPPGPKGPNVGGGVVDSSSFLTSFLFVGMVGAGGYFAYKKYKGR